MKRGAEKQLTRDDADAGDDEIEEVSPGQGFKKADETELEKRPIKGLPRRLSAKPVAPAPPAPSAASAPESVPKFSGFAGFGSATSTPFTFAPSQQQQKQIGPSPVATSAFGSSSSGAFSKSAFSTLNGPSATSSAPKSFPSFSAPTSGSASSSEPSSSAGSSGIKDDEFSAEVDYFVKLRGLNVSALSTITKAMESDPFADIGEILEGYKTFRISAKTSYDDQLKKMRGASTASSSDSAASKASSSAPLVTVSFTMPTPPSGFSGFNPPSAASASTSKKGSTSKGEEVNGSASSSKSSGFSFSTPPGSSDASAPPGPPKSTFTFGSSSSSSTASSSTPSFNFGSSAPQSFGKPKPLPFPFGKSESSSSDKSGDASSSSATSNLFVVSTPPPKSFNGLSGRVEEKGNDKETEQENDTSSTYISGSTSGSLFGGPTSFKTPEKSSSATSFVFGSGSPGKPSIFGSFGKAGSIGNPVGFGFGSPPTTPGAETTTFSSKGDGNPFAPPSKAESSKGDEHASGESGEGRPTLDAVGEAPSQLISTSVHDQEGEGEEHELTIHEIRSKVYKLVKDNEGENKWTDLGVGVLRLKKHKHTDVRRMLLRNSSTGKITINFIIYSGMNATVSRNTVSFIGHDEGTSTPFRIRTKTEEQANALKTVLDHEIEFTRSKSETL